MSGENTSGTLTQALPSIIASARSVGEFAGTWQRTCETQKRQRGTGLTWQEFTMARVNGANITETTVNNNSVTLAGTLASYAPQLAQVLIKITDRAQEVLSPNVVSQIGALTGNAMRRKKDEDYLSIFSGFATTASPGSGNPLSFGHISAAVANARSNTTEGATDDIFAVLHGFNVKDIQDEILAGVGTYTIPDGMTSEVFRQGFSGSVAGANVFTDNNITVDSTPNANGAVHARMGVLAIQGMAMKTETRRDPSFGGGADESYITDEYIFGERTSRGTQVFCYRIQADATAPTS